MDALSFKKMKFIRSLHYKSHRDKTSCFLVEGEKMVTELLQEAPERILFCVATSDFISTLYDDVLFYYCSADTLNKCSTLKTPNKIIAVVKKQNDDNKSFIQMQKIVLAIDGVQDPGNFGTIMRLADWFDIPTIICSPNTVDCFNPKVIQSSMGSFMRVTVHYTELKAYFAQSTVPIYGTFMDGESLYSKSLISPSILLMGNEGNGISKELEPYITQRISIPRFGKAESLNVSTATAICLSEFLRPK